MNKHRAIAFSKLCMCCETKQFLAYANYDVRKIADLRIFGIDRGETEQFLAVSQQLQKEQAIMRAKKYVREKLKLIPERTRYLRMIIISCVVLIIQ